VIVRTDLPNALEHFDIDALFGEAGKKAADGVRRPVHGLGDLRPAGAFVTARRDQNRIQLGARTWRPYGSGHTHVSGGEKPRINGASSFHL
jgi:hypothetical protein